MSIRCSLAFLFLSWPTYSSSADLAALPSFPNACGTRPSLVTTMAPTLARFAGMTEVASSLVPCLDFPPLQSLFQTSGRSYKMKVRPCLAFPCEYKLGSLQCLHGWIGSAPLASPKVTSCFSLPSHCTPSTLPSYSPSNKPGMSLPQDLCTIYFLSGMLFLQLRM